MDRTMEIDKEKSQELEQVHSARAENNHGSTATLNSEADLHEQDAFHHDEPFEEDHKQADYSSLSKKQLVDIIKDLSRDENFKKVDHILREIKPVFDEMREKERSEALTKFTAGGSAAEDFEYKGDELDITFDANYKLIRDRRNQFFKQQEDNKATNLQKKEALLVKLRELMESQDSNDQFEAFKKLQREWKTIGAVPGVHAKTIWANYHALVDRFYDNQSIYFELKELDRRRNLESKIELCVRAEKLANVEIIKDAIRELNELHHEFKHIGPVPMEEKEAVWQRFKAASDAVYARRDSYLQNLQQELHANLEKKITLSEEVQPFATFQSDRIKEWNQKTKELLDIQKRWETVGGLPRAKAKEINKRFWAAFKHFFSNKNIFFRKLDEEREHNLKLKNEFVQRAHELKDNEDWESTSAELKNLQTKWKEVGPVPEKFREKVFKEFKDACDHFFNKRRGQQGKSEEEQAINLQQKEEICSQLEQHIADKTATPELLKELQNKFQTIGFVPRKDINTIRNRYFEIVGKYVEAIPGLSEDDKSRVILENQLSDLKNDPMADRKIYQKEQVIRKKITKVENDIAVWKNNLEFFGRSKNADSYRQEFNDKINEASEHLKQLKAQLKLLRTV